MSDPFKKVRPGEPLDLNAEAFNFAMDAAKREKNKFGFMHDLKETPRQGSIIRVKNTSGSDQPARSILGLDTPVFSPTTSLEAFKNWVIMNAVTPTTAHAGKICITLEPIGKNQYGRAFVDGACQVRINVLNIAHTCAGLVPGNTAQLQSMAQDGSCGILWAEGGTGVQWGIVRLLANCECCPSCGTALFVKASNLCPPPANLAGVIVHFIQHSTGIEIATCTTAGAAGTCTATLPDVNDVYDLLFEPPYGDPSGDFSPDLSPSHSVTKCTINSTAISDGLRRYFVGIASSCIGGGGIPGVSVTVTESGVAVGTFTTGSNGSVPVRFPNSLFNPLKTIVVTASKTRWATGTFSGSATTNPAILSCSGAVPGGGGGQLVPASGFNCQPCCGFVDPNRNPYKSTLVLNDATWGAATVTFTGYDSFGYANYSGSKVVSYPGYFPGQPGGCPAVSVTINYQIGYVDNGPTGNDCGLKVSCLIDPVTDCPGGTGTGAFYVPLTGSGPPFVATGTGSSGVLGAKGLYPANPTFTLTE